MDEKTYFPSSYAKAVRTALPALEAAKSMYKLYQAMPKTPSKRKQQSKATTKRRGGKRLATAIKIDGTSAGTHKFGVSVGRRKRRKKSLATKIKEVKRLIPKKSTKLYRDFNTICLEGSQNQRRVYDIACFTNSDFETYAQNLTNVDSATTADYTTSNTSLKYDLYYKLMLKNNMTANCQIQYAFYVCKDDDNESPIDSVREELVDRGYTGLPIVTASAGPAATYSLLPKHIRFNPGSYHVPIFGAGALKRNWRIIGGVKTATIGPGDTTNLIHSRKLTYKPEIKDQEGVFTFLSNYDVRLVIVLNGDLGHDQNNTALVGRCAYQLDCEQQRQCSVMYGNPKGLREVAYSDDLVDGANFTIPVHADNKASQIETDDK